MEAVILRTEQEVEAEVRRIWAEELSAKYVNGTVEVKKFDKMWHITIKQMYEYVPLTLKHLVALSEFFGTQNISDSRQAWGGCETCDYGSSYEIDLTVKP